MFNLTSNTSLLVAAVVVSLVLAAFLLILLALALRTMHRRWLSSPRLHYRGTRRRGTSQRS